MSIAQNETLCQTYMGKYPVLFLSLKGVDGLTFEDAYDRLRCLIRNEAFRLDFLRESSAITAEEKNSYLRILSETDRFSDITESLKMLVSKYCCRNQNGYLFIIGNSFESRTNRNFCFSKSYIATD